MNIYFEEVADLINHLNDTIERVRDVADFWDSPPNRTCTTKEVAAMIYEALNGE